MRDLVIPTKRFVLSYVKTARTLPKFFDREHKLPLNIERFFDFILLWRLQKAVWISIFITDIN